MMKKCAIMQPTFNPWIGYFDLIDYVDCFIFLDTVQLNQQSWQTRNKFKFQGKEFLFSIPIVKSRTKKELLIKDTLIDFRKYDFRKKLFKSLEQNYKKAKHYEEVIDFVSDIVFYESKYLSDYNMNFTLEIIKKLGITTPIILASKIENIEGSKGDLVLNICKSQNIKNYVSPLGAKDYLEESKESFECNDVKIEYQKFQHPSYHQLGDVFIPYLGILDLIFNEGFEKSKEIIKSGRRYEDR